MPNKKTSFRVFPKDVDQLGSSDFIPGARENSPALDYLFNRRRRYRLPDFLSVKVIKYVFIFSSFLNLLLLLYSNTLVLSSRKEIKIQFL